MIPLIDVSLVLLIFFMLTTNPETSAAGPQIATPPAVYGTVVNAPDEVWVGINRIDKNGVPTQVYSLGVGAKAERETLQPGRNSWTIWRPCWRTKSRSI